MDERSASRMNTLFKVTYKGRCEIVPATDAHLGLVDIDSEANVWEKYREQFPELPTIVISESLLIDIDGVPSLTKPVKLNQLWDCIYNLIMGLPLASELLPNNTLRLIHSVDESIETPNLQKNSTGVSSAAGAMENKYNSTKTGAKVTQNAGSLEDVSLYFNPDNYLLGQLTSAINKNKTNACVIHVDCWSGRRLLLLPRKGLVLSDLTDSQMKNLGVARISKDFSVNIRIENNSNCDDLNEKEVEGLQSYSTEFFIWDLALRTSRGRVPDCTDLSKPQYLRSWPNFPRLPRTPHGMRISALWMNNPRTLDDIAINLGIDKSDVYSFHSAAYATGLVGPAKRQADNLIAPRDVDKKETMQRGLFASILRHIRNNDSA